MKIAAPVTAPSSLKQRIGRFLLPKIPFTTSVFQTLRGELNAMLVRGMLRWRPGYRKTLKRLQSEKELSVNIGCGGSGLPGWVNLDLFLHANSTMRFDTRRGVPLSPNSVRRIRCEHFFEHLDPEQEVPSFLKSCHEMLAPGGVLRVIVPDLERFVKAYAAHDKQQWLALGWDIDHMPSDIRTEMDILNHMFRQNGEHQAGYDFETLKLRLQEAGFSRIERMAFEKSQDAELTKDLDNHQPYSLYVEAIK